MWATYRTRLTLHTTTQQFPRCRCCYILQGVEPHLETSPMMCLVVFVTNRKCISRIAPIMVYWAFVKLQSQLVQTYGILTVCLSASVCMCACVRTCGRACVWEPVGTCVRVCRCTYVCIYACMWRLVVQESLRFVTYRCDAEDWRQVVQERARIHSCRTGNCVIPPRPGDFAPSTNINKLYWRIYSLLICSFFE